MNEPIRRAVEKGLRFIEENLQGEIGVSDVASCAAYSQFYFSREFSRLTHISVYDYILRRKLTESYKELFSKRCKIVDLAFRYGFQSHEVYTRAYRKMFGENPSESAEYKELALFAPIDGKYLDFLSGLRLDMEEHALPDCHFEIDGATQALEPDDDRSALVLLSPQNPWRCQCVLRGSIRHEKSDALALRLSGLRHVVRVYHTDRRAALRYFLEHICEAGAAQSNYILVLARDEYTDIALPMVGGTR